MSSLVGPDEDDPRGKPPVPEEVQNAIRTLIRWAGDDPSREGLLDTPSRVARAWKEYCLGYNEDPAVHLSRIFEEVGGYDEVVLLKDIPFQSHCEHHMAPIIGKAAIAYLPRNHVVGISKLARVLHGYARHLGPSQAPRRGRGYRGQPLLHDRPRGAHTRRGHDNQPDDGYLPRGPAQPRGGAEADGLLTRKRRNGTGKAGFSKAWGRSPARGADTNVPFRRHHSSQHAYCHHARQHEGL
jgi:hypothetical protein